MPTAQEPRVAHAAAASETPPPGRPRRRGPALLRACRPRQWPKNLLVLAVPAAAGRLGDAEVVADTLLACLAFVLVSSGTYLLNDAGDVEADRLHPAKRLRPIAAGEVPVRVAVVAGVAALAAGLAVAATTALALGAVVLAYVVLTSLYTRWLKHLPIYDIAAVASGFFLRAVAGGAASDLFISRWFLIVAGGGSLFLVVGKRYAEVRAGGAEAARRRAALAHYSPDYLRGMLSATAAITVLAYVLWCFEPHGGHRSDWTALSAVPFVFGIMRYGLLVEQGHGEEPEEILLHDRQLQGMGLVWLACLAAGVIG